jgi:hypothetical protein
MGCGCKKRNEQTEVQPVSNVKITFNETEFQEPITQDLTNVQTTTEDNPTIANLIIDKLNDINSGT